MTVSILPISGCALRAKLVAGMALWLLAGCSGGAGSSHDAGSGPRLDASVDPIATDSAARDAADPAASDAAVDAAPPWLDDCPATPCVATCSAENGQTWPCGKPCDLRNDVENCGRCGHSCTEEAMQVEGWRSWNREVVPKCINSTCAFIIWRANPLQKGEPLDCDGVCAERELACGDPLPPEQDDAQEYYCSDDGAWVGCAVFSSIQFGVQASQILTSCSEAPAAQTSASGTTTGLTALYCSCKH